MASNYQLLLNGQAADADLYTAVNSLEVEESLDLPGAVQLNVPVNPTESGDLNYVSDSRLQPLVNLAVVVTPAAGSSAGSPAASLGAAASALGVGGSGSPGNQCIFDGYILSQKLHLETGTTNSTLSVWGQDASWLMNLQENVKEWVDVTDADVANSIFGNYGITPASDNTDGRLALAHRIGAQPDAARLGHPVPQDPGASQREVLPGRLRRSARQAHRLLRQAESRRHAGGRPVAQRSGRPGRSAALDLQLGRDAPHVGHRPRRRCSPTATRTACRRTRPTPG